MVNRKIEQNFLEAAGWKWFVIAQLADKGFIFASLSLTRPLFLQEISKVVYASRLPPLISPKSKEWKVMIHQINRDKLPPTEKREIKTSFDPTSKKENYQV